MAARCLLSLICVVVCERPKGAPALPIGPRAWGRFSSATRGAGGEARRRSSLFCFETQDSGRWESGKPAFGFPLFHRPRRRRCGNVGISPAVWRDFQGVRGKRGKPAFGFPRFPQPRHFHSALASSGCPAAPQQTHLRFLHPLRRRCVAHRFGPSFQHLLRDSFL